MTLMTNVDAFAEHITKWHAAALLQFDHLINTPEDVGIEVTDHDTGKTRVLTPQERENFIEGVLVAREIVKELPFSISTIAEVPAEESVGDA